MFYAPGLVGYSAVKIASPTFYALRDSRTPVMVSMLSVVANVVAEPHAGARARLPRPGAGHGAVGDPERRAPAVPAARPPRRHRRATGDDGAFVKIAVASGVMAVAAIWVEQAVRQALPGDRRSFHACCT